MKIVQFNEANVEEVLSLAVDVLRAGGLIVYPTETCYGLGVDATNAKAVDKLLHFKTRREGKAISVVMASEDMAKKYVELNETARHLYRTFLPGPMTIISKVKAAGNSEGIPDQVGNDSKEGLMTVISKVREEGMIDSRVVSEIGTLGVRMPDHTLIMEIVKQLGRPVTATSANSSGMSNPYSLEQWEKQTAKKSKDLVDMWIDAGPLPQRPSSTVVDTTRDELTVVRQGGVVLGSTAQEYVTWSEKETKELAKKIIGDSILDISEKGLVIGLQGDLGMGKTRFAKGVASALGVKEEVRSPTFGLVEEYEIESKALGNLDGIPDKNRITSSFRDDKKRIFFHIDTWRMESRDELVGIGFREMLVPGNVVVIEWLEKVVEVVKVICEEKGVQLVLGTVEEGVDGGRVWRVEEIK